MQHPLSFSLRSQSPSPNRRRTMLTLPPEIISDILCRLPVKSLLRFRCTSKPWCSLIDAPHFTKLHLANSIQTNSHHSLTLINLHSQLFSVDLDSLKIATQINLPFKTLENTIELLGSCNGLMCLYKSDAEIFLLNVATGKHFLLPYTPIVFPKEATALNLRLHHDAYGFGYDSVHDDYKVIRITQFYCNLESTVVIYSSKSNSWKRVGDFPYDLPRHLLSAVFAGGAFHWVVNPKGDREGCLIAAFDLAAEKYRELPEPREAKNENFLMQLGVLEGNLCISCNYVKERVDVWVLKDYGVNESWSKLLSIAQPQVISSFSYIKALAYVRNRNEVLLVMDFAKLLRYDLKKKKVKNVRLSGLPDSFDAMVCVGSLVKPMPMASAADETMGKQGKGTNNKNVPKKRDDFLSTGFKLVL